MAAAAPKLCPRFTESWFNEPGDRRHVILGRRLRPFSEWHRFLLLSIESPLLSTGAVPTMADVRAAVRICCSNYRTPLASIHPSPARGQVARWLGRLRAKWITARYPLPLALAAFEAYVRDYMSPPDFWQKETSGAAEVLNNLPEPLTLTVALIAGGNFQSDNEAAVWDMPLGKAHWYATGFAKMAGADIRLRTESDKFFEQMRAVKQKIAVRRAAQRAKAKAAKAAKEKKP